MSHPGSSSSLRIGGLAYRNAEPLQRGLRPAPKRFSSANAARAFAAGEVDVALIPWAAVIDSGWEHLVVPGTGIAAKGAVYSVFVTWRGGRLPGPVMTEPQSRSSAALFEILRTKFAFFGPTMPPLLQIDGQQKTDVARLMIGDAAIDFRRSAGCEWQFLDLSHAWFESTGLPFVFAVWVARKNPMNWEEPLAGIRDKNLVGLSDWTQDWEDGEFWRSYYAGLRYCLGPEEEKGMRLFRDLLRGDR